MPSGTGLKQTDRVSSAATCLSVKATPEKKRRQRLSCFAQLVESGKKQVSVHDLTDASRMKTPDQFSRNDRAFLRCQEDLPA